MPVTQILVAAVAVAPSGHYDEISPFRGDRLRQRSANVVAMFHHYPNMQSLRAKVPAKPIEIVTRGHFIAFKHALAEL